MKAIDTAPERKQGFPNWLWWLALISWGLAAATTTVQVIIQYTWYWLAWALVVLVPLTWICVVVLAIGVLCNRRRRPWKWREFFIMATAGFLFLPFVYLPAWLAWWLLTEF